MQNTLSDNGIGVRKINDALKDSLSRTAHALAAEGAIPETLHHYRDRIPGALVSRLGNLVREPMLDYGCWLLKGALSDFTDLPGPTPASWDTTDPRQSPNLDIAFALLAAAAGRPLVRKRPTAGNLVHDIVPHKVFDERPVSTAGAPKPVWRTLDAYHHARPELVLLACVRNPDKVPMDVASIRRAELAADDVKLLSTTPALIHPNHSYHRRRQANQFSTTQAMTLWDTPDGLCLRFDALCTKLPESAEFHAAWRRLRRALDECATTITPEAGDVVVVDNDVAVSTQRPFAARYDGTDRWLKRALVRGRWRRAASELGTPESTPVPTRPYPSLYADKR